MFHSICHTRLLLLALTFSVTSATLASPPTTAPATQPAPRIINCDAHLQSHKHGICANKLSADDFRAIAPGVSWYYNWHFQPSDPTPAGVSIEFVPMVWTNDVARLEGLRLYLANAKQKPRAVLALNEPNLKGQAFITPEESSDAYKKIKAVADKYSIPVVGPHMALGSATGASIRAYDPLQKKDVTYTFMVPFLKAFFAYTGDTEVTATAFHSYGAIGEMHWAVDLMSREFKRPVWVTEYAQWKTPSPEAARTYLIQATDFLERSPNVPAYAWFKERVKDNPSISLLDDSPGKLTPLGQTYLDLPVHDADVYYRLPGKLPAENYTTLDKMEIYPTTDDDGFAHMTATEANPSITYQIHVEKPGIYTLTLRLSGSPGTLTITQPDGATRPSSKTLATLISTEKTWHTLTTSLTLPAGTQSLTLHPAKSQSLNWLEFTKP